MRKQTVPVIFGASGYLGRSIAWHLHCKQYSPIGIYTHQKFAAEWGWRRFTFPFDDASTMMAGIEAGPIIISAKLTSALNRHGEILPTDEYRDAFKNFIEPLSHHRIIFVSSDAVFRGDRGQYTETDLPAPESGHGIKTLASEEIIHRTCENFLILRTSYIYGYSNGMLDRRLEQFERSLADGIPASYSKQIYKSPAHADIVSKAVANASVSEHQGIIHIPAKRMSVYEFYKMGLHLLGKPEYEYLLNEQADSPLSDTSLTTLYMDTYRDLIREIPPWQDSNLSTIYPRST